MATLAPDGREDCAVWVEAVDERDDREGRMMRSDDRRGTLVVAILLTAAVLAATLAACGEDGGESSGIPGAGSASTIVGAGASFPYPLYSAWGSEYNDLNGIRLNYQSIGSGGGISAIQAGTVDFGASDAPLAADEIGDLLQWPQAVGGVVLVVNLDGVQSNQLRLTGELVAKIFMGEIAEWNDPAIAEVNGGIDLPQARINVVHRSDSSGTTWIFTNYLAEAAGDVWTLGGEKEIAWPTGVGGKGNEGVAASVQQLKGSIGYVEYAYAKETGLVTVQLRNADGEWVAPSLETFGEAAAEADWAGADDFYVVLVDQPGPRTWPITGASFILVQKQQKDPERARAMLGFFDWAFRDGASTAERLDYVPIPATVYELIQAKWMSITSGGEPVWSR
jgi:phosphate transport system substrate-binding protein